ncbi:MAG: hypothetical protein KF689_02055 [Gemmatimonadaceae bacterium]|nr:hypothetical protein [Gemmatimonadaceae bacterium]MCW5826718.1 hypothetical protein [Gemmatimonadaceae bacterium]
MRSLHHALPLLAALALAACGERRDISDLAAGQAPFNELRGTNVATLRAGEVRAFRRNAERSPLEGYREQVGAWDVLYAVRGYDGSDGSYPAEDVQILEVEATREWPSDSVALATWEGTVRDIRNATGATPHCLTISGPGFSLRVVEFDRGGQWRLAASVAPSVRLPNRQTLSARHAVAVRRLSLTERFPEQGGANPDSLPTWTRTECPGQ